MRSIVFEAMPNLIERLEKRLVLDAVRIEPAPVRELLRRDYEGFPSLAASV